MSSEYSEPGDGGRCLCAPLLSHLPDLGGASHHATGVPRPEAGQYPIYVGLSQSASRFGRPPGVQPAPRVLKAGGPAVDYAQSVADPARWVKPPRSTCQIDTKVLRRRSAPRHRAPTLRDVDGRGRNAQQQRCGRCFPLSQSPRPPQVRQAPSEGSVQVGRLSPYTRLQAREALQEGRQAPFEAEAPVGDSGTAYGCRGAVAAGWLESAGDLVGAARVAAAQRQRGSEPGDPPA